MQERDVVIIGGGPAGYRAAIRISQLGGKATLIDNDSLGGTCINHGCIPVRALLRSAEIVDVARIAKDYGVDFKEAQIDMAKIISRKNIVVRTLVSGVKQALGGNGVEVIEGTGRLLSPSQIEILSRDGGKKEIKARRIIIATGSGPKKASILGASNVITPEEAFELKMIPSSMLIVGGRFIGSSLATIFCRLGSKICIVESSPQILPGVDKEIASLFEKELENLKIQVYTEARLRSIEEKGKEEKEVVLDAKGKEVKFRAHYLLVAEEREAGIEGLCLDEVGIKLNKWGGIAVNGRMETNIPTILAAGDVTMEQMWTHVAYSEGMTAAENAMGKDSKINYSGIPYGTNTIPEIAGVGMTEEEAAGNGHDIRVGRVPFAGNGLATIFGQRTGLIKIITEGKYGQILGVHMMGPRASDLIAEATLALRLETTLEDIARVLHFHPTFSEAFGEAARSLIQA
jgi:dihydrolipoamide dehydrogenase